MPSSDPRRFRNWFLYAAAAVVVIVLAAYLYKRATFRSAVGGAPQQLSGPVERTTEGFSLSKSEAGRTLFTIHAARAIEYKQGGRAHLHDVNIIVYGKAGDRFDQISGPDFEYDPQSGDVQAHGEVHIDLEPNPQGAEHADQAPPREQKNIIHIRTTELRFNQQSGIAFTPSPVEFRLPQANGTCIGARMDSKAGILTLDRQVAITTTGDHPADITGDHGTLTHDPRQAVLDHAHVIQPDRQFDADKLTAFLDDQNQIQRMLAEGHVRSQAHSEKGDVYQAESPQQEFFFSARSKLERTVLRDGVTVQGTGSHLAHGKAQEAQVYFDSQQRLSKIHAQGDVHMSETSSAKPGQNIELISDALDLFAGNGRLTRGETQGAARIEIQPQPTPTSPEPEKTIVTAAKFNARFDSLGRLRLLHGEPDAKITSPSPQYGEPDRVSTSQIVEANFDPAGQVQSLLQKIGVHYFDGDHQAFAAQARYTPADQVLTLTGSPRVVDNTSGNTTADVIRVNRATNIAYAQGNVKSTYLNQKSNPNGAMLGSSSPVHVTADSMTSSKSDGAATYTGHARLWQDSNIIQAPEIKFFRDRGSMTADAGPGHPIESVLLQTSSNGKQTPVNVTAQHFSYLDDERLARYQTAVLMKGEDGTLSCDALNVYLKPRSQTAPAPANKAEGNASQIDHAVAEGDVILRQPGRQGIGRKLVYTDADQKFVLTGAPGAQPEVTDVQHGITRGDVLTFFRGADNRVLVQSTGAERVYTQTTVK